jgi:hypothetical protein
MVRRGSTVRVRQRALQKPRKAGLIRSGALAWSTTCDGYGALYGAFRSRRASVRSQKRPHWARRRSFHRDVLRGLPHRAGDFGVAVVCWLIRSPPDERDGHGRLDRARVVRALRRHVGRDDGGDDAAWRSASRPAVRRRQRSRRRVAPLSGLVPRRLGTVRARRLRPLPAARRVCRGRSNNRGLRLRAHAAEARMPASLPRQRPFFRFGMFCVGSSVGLMLVLVALEPMSVMAGRGRRHRARPEAPAAASRHRRAVGPRDRGLGIATVL